jgi:hypothetical protein
MDKYILDEHGNPKLEPDLMAWATWYGSGDDVRRVARTQIGQATVSTVFLALDHSWSDGPPVLWRSCDGGNDALYLPRGGADWARGDGHQVHGRGAPNREQIDGQSTSTKDAAEW